MKFTINYIGMFKLILGTILGVLFYNSINKKDVSNSSPPVRTSNSTSLTSDKPKGFNMGLEVPTSSPPKLSPTEITSPNPNIKRNLSFGLQAGLNRRTKCS